MLAYVWMLDRNHSIEKSVCVNVCKWVLRIAKCYIWTSPFTIRREMLGEGVKENWRKEVRGYEWFICQQQYYIYHISLVQFNILKCIYLNLFMLYWTQKPVYSNSILKHHNDTIRCWKHCSENFIHIDMIPWFVMSKKPAKGWIWHSTAAYWVFSLFLITLYKPQRWLWWEIPLDLHFMKYSDEPAWH